MMGVVLSRLIQAYSKQCLVHPLLVLNIIYATKIAERKGLTKYFDPIPRVRRNINDFYSHFEWPEDKFSGPIISFPPVKKIRTEFVMENNNSRVLESYLIL